MSLFVLPLFVGIKATIGIIRSALIDVFFVVYFPLHSIKVLVKRNWYACLARGVVLPSCVAVLIVIIVIVNGLVIDQPL